MFYEKWVKTEIRDYFTNMKIPKCLNCSCVRVQKSRQASLAQILAQVRFQGSGARLPGLQRRLCHSAVGDPGRAPSPQFPICNVGIQQCLTQGVALKII